MKKIIGLLIAIVVLSVANITVSNHHIFASAPKEIPDNYSEIAAENLYNDWLLAVNPDEDGHSLILNYADDKLIKYLPYDVLENNQSEYLNELNDILGMVIPISGFKTRYSANTKTLGSNIICASVETKMEVAHFDDYVAIQSKVETIANDISSKVNTEREKVELLNKYLIETVAYDTTLGANLPEGDMRIWESWGALNDGVAVCSGYVNAFAQICEAMEIKVVSVVGYRDRKDPNDDEEVGHEWNEVYIEGRWLAVDVTSNDPIIVGGEMDDAEKNQKYGNDFLLVNQSYLKELNYEWDEKNLDIAKKLLYPYLTLQEEI